MVAASIQGAVLLGQVGPRLQMLTDQPGLNRYLEHRFSLHAESIRLAEKLRTMRMARAQDGEAFGLLTSNPALQTSEKLDLRLLEADQVTTPDRTFDDFGNPIAREPRVAMVCGLPRFAKIYYSSEHARLRLSGPTAGDLHRQPGWGGSGRAAGPDYDRAADGDRTARWLEDGPVPSGAPVDHLCRV